MSKKLRSAFFHNVASISDKFSEHLSEVWELSDREREIILKFLPQITRSITEKESKLVIESCIAEIGVTARHDLLESISVLESIYRVWSPSRDNAKTVLEDLEIIGVLPVDSEKIVFCSMAMPQDMDM